MFGRNRVTREFHILAGAIRVSFKDHPGSDLYYRENRNGKWEAMGFQGRAQKPFFHHTFKTKEAMSKFVTEAFDRVHKNKAARKANRASAADGHTVKVGDIFTSSWGYEQTNVYYYQVVELKGKSSVVVRRIAGEREYTGAMAGKMTPVKNAFLDRVDPITKRIQSHDGSKSVYLKMESYEYAYPWDGQPKTFTEYH